MHLLRNSSYRCKIIRLLWFQLGLFALAFSSTVRLKFGQTHCAFISLLKGIEAIGRSDGDGIVTSGKDNRIWSHYYATGNDISMVTNTSVS
jgi:hypothetical protein